ncbi:MAG TPA: ornithine carbamoyltransferase [Microlunatus sp.]
MIRHFLVDDDLSPAEQAQVLALAGRLKADPYAARSFAGPRCIAVMFDKPTLRTQSSFAAGIAELGGYPMMVDGRLAGIGERESVADTARVLGRQAAAIVWRTFAQSALEEMAEYSGVPAVNALTDSYHPCQILADLMTIAERFGRLSGLRFAYVGDGANNMANSYLLGGATAGLHVRIGAPAGFQPDPAVVARSEAIAARTGGSVLLTTSASEAVAGCDAVATDTWVSMGQESTGRESIFVPYAVTPELFAQASPDAIVLHCLPAYRGKEISAEVIDGPRSAVWDEAENRRHVQKAVLVFLDAASRGETLESLAVSSATVAAPTGGREDGG